MIFNFTNFLLVYYFCNYQFHEIFHSLLVDTRDRQAPQMTYVPEENIEVIKGTKILHPKVEDHFETYDGSQYIPRPWLRTLYPYD